MTEKLKTVLSHLMPRDNKATNENKPLPLFDELPKFHDFMGCAWSVWGDGDQLGTVNLLTDEVVRRAAQEEVRHVILCLIIRNTPDVILKNWSSSLT
jgi:hypothetical protein